VSMLSSLQPEIKLLAILIFHANPFSKNRRGTVRYARNYYEMLIFFMPIFLSVLTNIIALFFSKSILIQNLFLSSAIVFVGIITKMKHMCTVLYKKVKICNSEF
jgi:hypothetical protein